jgi:hypothetical protein
MKSFSPLYLPLAVTAALLAVACSNPEDFVVEKYFQAVNTQDNATLQSFALIGFDKKVEKWAIKRKVSDNKEPAPLAELVKKQKAVEAQINENKKQYIAYNLDHTVEVTQVREAKKSGSAIPAKLAPIAAEWDKFTEKEKELKRALAEAKAAVEKEKKNMMVSIGNVDEVDGLEGEVLTKQLEIELTIEGSPQPYLMTLKKYDVKAPGGRALVSRWIIAGLQKA